MFDLPAGPLGVAIGAEYRKESSNEDWDALTNAGLNGGNVLPDTSGRFNVKEAYGEINVPLLKDLPFVQQLNARAAGRISDYSTIGSVKTWEIGGDWAPVSGHQVPGHPRQGGSRTEHRRAVHRSCRRPSRCSGSMCRASARLVAERLATNCRAAPGVLANIAANGDVHADPGRHAGDQRI